MAVTSGTVHSVSILKAPNSVDTFGWALVLFTMSGTYAQADDSKLVGVPTLIQNSVRNGKTVTMRSVAVAQHTYRTSDGTALGLKTEAISSADITFELTKSTTTAYATTEFDDATAIPAQAGVFGLFVCFTES